MFRFRRPTIANRQAQILSPFGPSLFILRGGACYRLSWPECVGLPFTPALWSHDRFPKVPPMSDRTVVHGAYAEVRRTGPGVAQQIDHAHHQLEFNLIVAGKGAYFVEDGHHDLVPGTLVWLLPEQRHRLMRSPDFDMWVVICDCGAFNADFLADIAASPCTVLSTEDAVALDRLLSHISQDLDDPELYRSGLEYAVRSARHASVTTAGPPRRKPHPAVVKALSILRSEAEAPDAGALARMCGVSRHYLGQLLTEQTGRSYVEWRNRARLERFHELFPQTQNLATTSFAAGFGSYVQFHRVFVEVIGSTPGEWAKSRIPAMPQDPRLEFGAISGGPGGSTRMACYELCGMPFPLIGKALGKPFGIAMASGATAQSADKIASGFTAGTNFSALESALLAESHREYGPAAEKLGRFFAKNDVLASYKAIFPYAFELEDLASILGLHLLMAWIIAGHRHYPTVEQITSLIRRVRQALHQTPSVGKLAPEAQKLLTAALITEIVIMRNALVGAKSSGKAPLIDQIRARIRNGAARSLGLDLQGFELWPPADALTIAV